MQDLLEKTEKMVLNMTFQTTVRSNHFEIQLNYEKLEKNLGKLIKIHNQLDNLYVLPDSTNKGSYLLEQTFSQTAPLRRSCIEQKPIARHTYPLNSNQAVQLIWRAAKIAKELGVTPAALKDIENDDYKGEKNRMSELIKAIEKEINQLEHRLGRNHKRTLKARKYVSRLRHIEQSIERIWANIRLHHQNTLQHIKQQPMISLYSPNMEPQEKVLIVKHLRRQILNLDLKLLKESIIFIEEIKGSNNCLVVLEQSYFAFLTNHQKLTEIIGMAAYNEGLKNYEIAKEIASTEKKPFKVKGFSMCHKCLEMFIPDPNSEESYICTQFKPFPDATTTSYAYQQIMLLANYSVIPEFYQKSKGRSDEITYDRYVHPYANTFSATCSRFICHQCFPSYSSFKKKKKNMPMEPAEVEVKLESAEIPRMKRQLRSSTTSNHIPKEELVKIEKPKLKKPPYCHFCEFICECERCWNLQSFNRLLAIYVLFGGDFQDVASDLIFCNWLSKRLEIKVAYDSDLDHCDRLTDIQMQRPNAQAILTQPKTEKQHATENQRVTRKSKRERLSDKIKQKQENKIDRQKIITESLKVQNAVVQNEQSPVISKIKSINQCKHQNTTADSQESVQYTNLKALFMKIRIQQEFEPSPPPQAAKNEHFKNVSPKQNVIPKQKKNKKGSESEKGGKLKYSEVDSDNGDPQDSVRPALRKRKIQLPDLSIEENNDFYFESEDQNCKE